MRVGGKTINISFGDMTTDLDFATYFPNGVKVAGIGFRASSAGDVLVLKDRTAAGVVTDEILGSGSITYSESVWKHLFLDISACTIAVPASALLIIELA
jgi:hypothetical protein